MKGVSLIKFYQSVIQGLEAVNRGFDLIVKEKLLNLDDVSVTNYFPVVKSMLVNVKLDYYCKVRDNWLEREKIEFLVELEENMDQCKKYLSDKIIFQGVKEIYSTLGNYCLKKKSYKDAIRLYQAGMHFNQERKAIVEWLETILKRSNRGQQLGYQDSDQAKNGIRRLTSFGYVNKPENGAIDLWKFATTKMPASFYPYFQKY